MRQLAIGRPSQSARRGHSAVTGLTAMSSDGEI